MWCGRAGSVVLQIKLLTAGLHDRAKSANLTAAFPYSGHCLLSRTGWNAFSPGWEQASPQDCSVKLSEMFRQNLNSDPGTPVRPLALQSLDHSQLYQRRVLHLEQNERNGDLANSPTTGDYEDLSENDWTSDQNSSSSATWTPSPEYRRDGLPYRNVAPALPARSTNANTKSLMLNSVSLPLHASNDVAG